MNKSQQSLPWLEPSWSQLKNYIKQNRIPQALLIIGNKGLGKQQLAEQFSQTLMCSSQDREGACCGQCQGCTLFNAKTHPDYIFIEPEDIGKEIGIGVIRQLTSKLALKPQFESYRIVIINPADKLNTASANAFLKYLEEPTERTCLILVTDSPSKLPATISSRCQKLRVTISDAKIARSWLKQQGVSENIELLLNMAQGSPLLAKQLATESALKNRMDYFNQWLDTNRFISTAEQWSKLNNDEQKRLLTWLTSWSIDIIKLRVNKQSAEIMNVDLLNSLQDIANKLELKKLYKYYDFLLHNKQRLDTQLNKQLMFEEILINWSELKKG